MEFPFLDTTRIHSPCSNRQGHEPTGRNQQPISSPIMGADPVTQHEHSRIQATEDDYQIREASTPSSPTSKELS